MRGLLIPLLLLTLNVIGQDCNVLNSFTSFKGVKLNQKFPDSLKGISLVLDGPFDNAYVISRDLKRVNNFKRIEKYLDFGATFTSISFECLNDDRLFSYVLYKDFDVEDSASIAAHKDPIFYLRVLDEIERLFDKPTDSLNTQYDFGSGFNLKWDCTNIRIDFKVFIRHKSFTTTKSFFSLAITDKKLERLKNVEYYK